MKTREASRKTRTIAYWVVTVLLSAELLTGGVWDVLRTHYVVAVVTRLGYPTYILTLLGVWKLLAVPALLAPGLPRLKEWACAGVFFEMTGAAMSHATCGEGRAAVAPLIFAALAILSSRLRPQNRIGSAVTTEVKA